MVEPPSNTRPMATRRGGSSSMYNSHRPGRSVGGCSPEGSAAEQLPLVLTLTPSSGNASPDEHEQERQSSLPSFVPSPVSCLSPCP
ncbi:hypothetical protein Fmac_032292 [Flemingia macrophylla]|uniref:Uncharacterized protein n=1 Tax=Flemingia macrophylla TaxID=520843 RepID=A0ABD1L4H8_9FABA